MTTTAARHSLAGALAPRLAQREAQAIRRRLRPLAQTVGTHVELEGRRLLQCCSNDYLGLASHPAVTRAAAGAVRAYGAGAGSARLVAGTSTLHAALENDLAHLKGTEAALVFSSGYHVNAGLLPALAGDGDLILSDALNHASLIDGCRLSRAGVRVYRHADAGHLEELLRDSSRFRHRFVVTESVFAMDGDLAPLDEIVAVARRHDAWLVVDEAHATGVFGPTGGGLVEQLDLTDAVDAQIGTLSKALGSLGGFVAGSHGLIDWVLNAARTFVYTTALPPAVVAAGRAAIPVMRAEPERRKRLWSNAAALRGSLERAGFRLADSASPILPVLVGDADDAVRLADALLERGVLVPAIRPPTVPEGTARLRVTPMATHTDADLEEAAAAFAAAGRATGLLG